MNPIKRIIKTGSTCAGNGLLSISATRGIMNRLFERRSQRFVRAFFRLFDQCRPAASFNWNHETGHGVIFLPVRPEFPRSWIVALSSRNHEPHLTAFFRRFMTRHPHGTFFDVGANYGFHSYPFLAGGYRCLLFEPQEECGRYIALVSQENNFSPLVEPCILSDCPGEVTFYVSESTWFSSTSREVIAASNEPPRAVLVPARTLDSVTSARGIDPDIIKIDVEGHEGLVLAGATETLRRARPLLTVEIHVDSPNRPLVFERLGALDYACLDMNQPQLRMLQSYQDMPRVGVPDFLFCPREKVESWLALV